MKLVAMHEAKAKLSEYVAESQTDRVLITSHGKPVAIVIGVAGEDLEDLLTRSDRQFWEMIERVREQPTIPLAEAQPYFDAADAFEEKHGRPMTPAEARKLLVKKTTAVPPNKAMQPTGRRPRSARQPVRG
jgi:prevent-host-death family protein